MSEIWDMMQGVGTVVAAGVAAWQIRSLKLQQKGWETLKACEKYDLDPTLDVALKKLREARDSGKLLSSARAHRLEASTVLNFLEGLAIGIDQGFYEEAVVKAFLEPTIRDHVREFLVDPKMASTMEIDPTSYEELAELIYCWDYPQTKPWYKRLPWRKP